MTTEAQIRDALEAGDLDKAKSLVDQDPEAWPTTWDVLFQAVNQGEQVGEGPVPTVPEALKALEHDLSL